MNTVRECRHNLSLAAHIPIKAKVKRIDRRVIERDWFESNDYKVIEKQIYICNLLVQNIYRWYWTLLLIKNGLDFYFIYVSGCFKGPRPVWARCLRALLTFIRQPRMSNSKYLCRFCGEPFSTKSNLVKHERFSKKCAGNIPIKVQTLLTEKDATGRFLRTHWLNTGSDRAI